MNYLAIIVATISNLVLGFLFYSPVLFGNIWAKAMGENGEQMAKPPMYAMIVSLIGAFVEALVIAYCIKAMNITTAEGGIKVGVILWLGLVVVTSLAWFKWQNGIVLFLINNGYQLIGILVMSLIISLWK